MIENTGAYIFTAKTTILLCSFVINSEASKRSRDTCFSEIIAVRIAFSFQGVTEICATGDSYPPPHV